MPLPAHPSPQLYSKTLTAIKPLSTDGFQSPNNTISHTPHVLGPWKSCAGIFTLSVFEKPNPGAMYVSTFKQDSITGGWPRAAGGLGGCSGEPGGGGGEAVAGDSAAAGANGGGGVQTLLLTLAFPQAR